MAQERTRYGLEIPALGSLILTHSLDKQVPALKEFAPQDRPNSTIVFWSFRLMAGLGMLMILLGALALWLRYRQRLYQSKPFLRFALWMGPSGLIAILAGWVTTEVGRQPWVVYGVQRTADAVSAHGDLHMTLSLLTFFVVYSSVFGVGYSYMLRLIRKGPQTFNPPHPVPRPARSPRQRKVFSIRSPANGDRSFSYLVRHYRLRHPDVHRDGWLRFRDRHFVLDHPRC
jgi:cytochrome d ubiquinol oxidase subunit I